MAQVQFEFSLCILSNFFHKFSFYIPRAKCMSLCTYKHTSRATSNSKWKKQTQTNEKNRHKYENFVHSNCIQNGIRIKYYLYDPWEMKEGMLIMAKVLCIVINFHDIKPSSLNMQYKRTIYEDDPFLQFYNLYSLYVLVGMSIKTEYRYT